MVYCRIEGDGPWMSRAIETIYNFAFHTSRINRVIESTDDAMISVVKHQTSKTNLINVTYPCARQYLMWFKVE